VTEKVEANPKQREMKSIEYLFSIPQSSQP